MSDFNESVSREGALHGITWRTHMTNVNYPDAAKHPSLNIGALENFQIHLSYNTDTNDYRMQLWEMTVVTQYDETSGQTAATPQYSILIPNATIKAVDLDEAKCQAVSEVLQYISNDYAASMSRYENMLRLFGDLDKTLADKTARRRAAEPIETLGLSGRALINLQAAGIRVIGELTSKKLDDVKNLSGIGDMALNNIRTCMHRANLRFVDETTESINMHDLAMANAAKNQPAADDAGDEAADNGENAEKAE